MQKLENGLVGLSHRVYAMIEDINQKIPDPPVPRGGGETADLATLTALLEKNTHDIKAEFEDRSTKMEMFSIKMFDKLTSAQMECTKEMSKGFQEMRREIHDREGALRKDWEKTEKTLHNMQGAVQETMLSQVGELDTQKKNMAHIQKEVTKMRGDTSEALHLLAKKMMSLSVEGGGSSPPPPPPSAYSSRGPGSTSIKNSRGIATFFGTKCAGNQEFARNNGTTKNDA